jgi:hypothetical protein
MPELRGGLGMSRAMPLNVGGHRSLGGEALSQPGKDELPAEDPRRSLALGHGIYWIVSGLWPIFHIRSFEAVTGPKADKWLVKTVAALISVIGAGLVLGARNKRVTPELETIAVGSALSLSAIDVVYVAKGRISKIYLLDAVVHTALAIAWRLAGSRTPASR